jgi:hypothetical protein
MEGCLGLIAAEDAEEVIRMAPNVSDGFYHKVPPSFHLPSLESAMRRDGMALWNTTRKTRIKHDAEVQQPFANQNQ